MDRPRRDPPRRRLRNGIATFAPAVVASFTLVGGVWLALNVAVGRASAEGAAAVPVAAGTAAAASPCAAASTPLRRSVAVAIPEVYELANVALTLSAYANDQVHTAWRSGDYYDAVMRHFAPYRDHPLIQALDRELTGSESWSHYYNFRENSAAWSFSGDSLIRSEPRTYWPGPDLFARHAALVRDFALVTGFRRFHEASRPEYDAQLRSYRQRVDVEHMWSWIEERFPQRYAHYRILFSPLIKGSHSTSRFADSTVMFIGGPAIVSDLPAEQQPVALARIVFTEIDHNYVNPTSDRFRADIARSFADVARWNTDTVAYGTPYGTFNEYMTWAVFSLYLRDRFPADIAARGIDAVEKQMHRRGFIRFDAFNQAVLRIAARHGDTCIPALYPPILAWSAGS